MEMNVRIEEVKPGSYNVAVSGRVDSANYTELEEKTRIVLDKNARSVVLDLKDLNYISSAGLGVIFTLMKGLKKKNGELLLCNLQPQIKKVFEIVRAMPLSNIFTSMEEADAYLEHMMNEELGKQDGSS